MSGISRYPKKEYPPLPDDLLLPLIMPKETHESVEPKRKPHLGREGRTLTHPTSND